MLSAGAGFIGFCLAASAVYVFNDMVDAGSDAVHPLRHKRPLAAAAVTVRSARVFLLVLLGLACLCCLLLGSVEYCLVLAGYVVLNVFYTLKLKRLPVVDALCVATGFLLRVFAGAVVIEVPVSPWLAGLTFVLALVLAFAKRRCDRDICQAAGGAPTSVVYNQRLLTVMIIVPALVTMAGYVFYTLSPAVIREHEAPRLYLTAPWVALGLLRYLWIVFGRRRQCYPVEALLRDHWLQVIILGWVVSLWLVIY